MREKALLDTENDIEWSFSLDLSLSSVPEPSSSVEESNASRQSINNKQISHRTEGEQHQSISTKQIHRKGMNAV